MEKDKKKEAKAQKAKAAATSARLAKTCLGLKEDATPVLSKGAFEAFLDAPPTDDEWSEEEVDMNDATVDPTLKIGVFMGEVLARSALECEAPKAAKKPAKKPAKKRAKKAAEVEAKEDTELGEIYKGLAKDAEARAEAAKFERAMNFKMQSAMLSSLKDISTALSGRAPAVASSPSLPDGFFVLGDSGYSSYNGAKKHSHLAIEGHM